MNNRLLLPSIVLAVGLLLAATVFGLFFHHSRQAPRKVQVVGMATRAFTADRVKWRLTLQTTATMDAVIAGQRRLRQSLEGLQALLAQKGLAEEAVHPHPPGTFPIYDRNGQPSGYTLQQAVFVISDRLATVEALAFDPAGLLEQGILIQNSELQYFYSQVDSLKKTLLSDAAVNARERAEELLKNTDLRLGRLVGIRAGVFQITEPYSTEVSGAGVYNTSSRQKEIKVTAHAEFGLE
jgi:hypothetical protein